MQMKIKEKKGAGMVSGIVSGIVGLVLLLVLAYVMLGFFTDGTLLTTGSTGANATTRMVGNFTTGVDGVSAKIPTMFNVAVFVLIVGLLVYLALQARRSQQAMGGSSI